MSAAVGHAAVPDGMRLDHGRHQPVEPLAGARRQSDDRHALDLRQHAIDFLAQPRPNARLPLDQVDFVEADNDRAAFALDKIGDRMSCSSNGVLRVDEDDDHFSEADGVERIGDRQFLELLLERANAGANPRYRECASAGHASPDRPQSHRG